MKIRNGFVSNSSSSSFVILGKKLKDDEETMNYLKEKYPGEFKDFIEEYLGNNQKYNLNDFLNYLVDEHNIEEDDIIYTEYHGIFRGEILTQCSSGEDELFELTFENGKIILNGQEIEMGDNNLYIFEDVS